MTVVCVGHHVVVTRVVYVCGTSNCQVVACQDDIEVSAVTACDFFKMSRPRERIFVLHA